MITRLITVFSIVSACFVLWSCASSKAQLSASTMLLVNEYNKAKQNSAAGHEVILPERVVEDYALHKIGAKYITNALITVDKNPDENELTEIGVSVNTKTNNIWSITVPLDALEKLASVSGVESIDIGIKSNNR